MINAPSKKRRSSSRSRVAREIKTSPPRNVPASGRDKCRLFSGAMDQIELMIPQITTTAKNTREDFGKSGHERSLMKNNVNPEIAVATNSAATAFDMKRAKG